MANTAPIPRPWSSCKTRTSQSRRTPEVEGKTQAASGVSAARSGNPARITYVYFHAQSWHCVVAAWSCGEVGFDLSRRARLQDIVVGRASHSGFTLGSLLDLSGMERCIGEAGAPSLRERWHACCNCG